MNRKESLIIATIDVIDELGIMGLSTREIAKREGVSEATLFRHYKSKNALLLAVLDYFLQFDADIFQETTSKNITPKEKMIYFINSLTDYYENYPAITSIMQMLDVLRYDPDLEQKVLEIWNNRTQYIKQLVEDTIGSGDLCPEIYVDAYTELINGCIREICLEWRIKNRQFSLNERTLLTINILLNIVPCSKKH